MLIFVLIIAYFDFYVMFDIIIIEKQTAADRRSAANIEKLL